MKWNYLFYAVLLTIFSSSCDDGRIPEKEIIVTEKGRVVKLTADLVGLDNWHSDYDVVLAGFTENSSYSAIAKDLSISVTDNGHVEMVMSGIGDNVRTLEVCVSNSIRERIATFYSMEAPATTDTIRMDIGTLNVSMYDAIQKNIFTDKCIQCHGAGSGKPAAGLHLTEDRSYADLYGCASTILPGVQRVNPGKSDESILYNILTTDMSAGWAIDHSQLMSTDENLLTFVKNWIDNGAKEK